MYDWVEARKKTWTGRMVEVVNSQNYFYLKIGTVEEINQDKYPLKPVAVKFDSPDCHVIWFSFNELRKIRSKK